ncbi:hypothetical protein [Aestuariibius sp. HNIBRBA575]|uniref:hypothetical protein n=1 Tax=Aestuariibius sp. HNIBRBA575 TaxID=3233343 RepID=UPI0034A1DF95
MIKTTTRLLAGASFSFWAVVLQIQAETFPASAMLFGYAGIDCDLISNGPDGPKSSYWDEVADFTNANQVCVTADMQQLAQRLDNAAQYGRPVFYLEPVFFEQTGDQLVLASHADVLWQMVVQAIHNSGVPPEDLIFYMADEPYHRNVNRADLVKAAQMIRATFARADILVIEAARPNPEQFYAANPNPIPDEIRYWGFNAYTMLDPSLNPAYMRELSAIETALQPDQSMALIVDATHTPIHRLAGLRAGDMGDVALNYARLAQTLTRVDLVLAYSWVGGIDGRWEKGVRDMPQHVQDTHRAIGLALTGR